MNKPFEMLHIPWVECSYWVRSISVENLYLINSDKNQITWTRRSRSLAKSPEKLLLRFLIRLWMHLCFLLLPKVCDKVFIKKEVVCLFLAFIDNIFFSIIQPSNSVNMAQFVGLIFGANLFETSFSKVSFKILPLFMYKRIPFFQLNVLSNPF